MENLILCTSNHSQTHTNTQSANHEPELIDQTAKSIPANSNEYCKGILSGRRKFELEKIRGKSGENKHTKVKDIDKGRDI